MTHADLPGGWRTLTLQNALYGNEPIRPALERVGFRGRELERAERDLTDAIQAYQAGDRPTALAVASDLAAEIKQARKPGRGAAA